MTVACCSSVAEMARVTVVECRRCGRIGRRCAMVRHFRSKHIKAEYRRHFCSCCAFGASRKRSMDQHLDSKGHKKKAKGKGIAEVYRLNSGAAPAIRFSDRRNDGSADLYVLPPKEAAEFLKKKEEPKAPAPSSSSASSPESSSEMEDSPVRWVRVKSKVNLAKELDCSSSSDSGLETPDCVIIEEDEAVVPASKAPKLELDKREQSEHQGTCAEKPKVSLPRKVAKAELLVPNEVPKNPVASVTTQRREHTAATSRLQVERNSSESKSTPPAIEAAAPVKSSARDRMPEDPMATAITQRQEQTAATSRSQTERNNSESKSITPPAIEAAAPAQSSAQDRMPENQVVTSASQLEGDRSRSRGSGEPKASPCAAPATSAIADPELPSVSSMPECLVATAMASGSRPEEDITQHSVASLAPTLTPTLSGVVQGKGPIRGPVPTAGDKILPVPVSIDREDRLTRLLERNNQLLEANLQTNLDLVVAFQQQASAFNIFATAMKTHTEELTKWRHERKLENNHNQEFWNHNTAAFNRAMKGMPEPTNPRF